MRSLRVALDNQVSGGITAFLYGSSVPSKGADVSGILQTRISGRDEVYCGDARAWLLSHQDRVHDIQVQLSQIFASRLERKTAERNTTHRKYEFKVIDEGPANCVTILFIPFLILTAFNECLTDETVHR